MKKKLLTLFLAVCAATCLSLGLSACGGTEHTLTKTEAKNATCTVDGNVEYWYCSDCGKYFSDENAKTEITKDDTVIKAGHTEVADAAVAATCTEAGKTAGSHCSVCGAVIKAQEVVPALGHSWDEGKVTAEATCTEDGVMTYTCTVCKETKTEVIAAGHNWGEISYVWSDDNSTCTATRTCSECNYVETETATAILSVTTAPTCTGRGNGEYTATFGNSAFVTHIKPVTINATGHTFSTEWSSDETNHWHVCENCDATADEAAHTYGEWKYDSTSLKCVRTCSVCGYDDTATAAEVGAVAAIGETCYASLEEAVEAVSADNTKTTIVLLSNATGSGIKVQASQNIVFDLNNHVYKVNEGVGSTNTETNGFQLLNGATVKFENGSLVAYGSTVLILIQNYCDLTLDGVKLYAENNAMMYALSSNHGTVTITGNTEITAYEDESYGYAVDIMFWNDSEAYSADGTQLTFDADFTGKVTGKIAVGGRSGTQDPGEKLQFIVAAGCQGTFDVTFSTYNLTFDKNIVISGGTYSAIPDTSYLAEGYVAIANNDGTYCVTTLQDALSAGTGAVVTLLNDVTVSTSIVVESGVTLDLNGHTVTAKLSENTAAAFQVDGANANLTVQDSSNDKNGKIASNGYGVYALNGGSVVVTSGTIEGYYSALSSNNTTGAGNFTVSGGTLKAENGPAIYMPAQYTLTITGGTITGGIIARMGTINISGGTIQAPTENLDKINDSNNYYKYSGNVWLGGALTLIAGTYSFAGGNDLTVNVTGGTFVNSYNGDDSQFANGITVYMMGKVEQKVAVSVSESTTFTLADGAKDVVFVDVESVVGGGFDSAYSNKNNGSLKNVPEYNGEKLVTIVGTEYSTLAAAVEAAGNTETTIVLLGDAAEDVTVAAGQNITLDLNGHTLTNASGHTITNNGTLTIKDGSEAKTGTVDNVTHAKAALFNNGTATILSGTYTRSKENGKNSSDNGGNSYYVLLNHGTLTIGAENADNANVTVTQNGKYSSMIENGWYNGNENTGAQNSKLVIWGGTFTGGLNTVKNDDYGEAEIHGGEFKNVSQWVVLNWNKLTISGGTFTATTDSGTSADGAICTGKINDTCDVGETTITGGTFTGKLAADSDYSSVKYEISGGTYSVTPDNGYIAEGYEATSNADGTYTVAAKQNSDDPEEAGDNQTDNEGSNESEPVD